MSNVVTKTACCVGLLGLGLINSKTLASDVDVLEDADPRNNQFVSFEYLTGPSDMHGLRIAYRPDIATRVNWPLLGELRFAWEASVNFFDLHGSSENETTYGISFSPVLLKDLGNWSTPYSFMLEAGIGISYVHDKKFGGVDIGSTYQFEDRLGLLMNLNQRENTRIGIRLVHYSNGGFNTKNPGLDFISAVYMTKF